MLEYYLCMYLKHTSVHNQLELELCHSAFISD